MLRFEEALQRILSLGSPTLPSELVPIDDLDGRILAEDVIANVDLPGFDYSSMDGYAVRVADLTPALTLRVKGESKTGVVPPPLEPATTMRIFTGAPLPANADAVMMQENVTRQGDLAIFSKAPRVGQSIRKKGEDLSTGAVAIAKNTRLRPSHLALAASLDRASLSVVAKPEVAILATGDELRRPGTPAKPGTIAESNTVVLRSMARRAGANARAHDYVPDDRASHEEAFAKALAESDVLLTIGGVSVGDHDLVRPALEAVGVKLDFWKVAIKPGKPLAVGRFERPNKRDAIVLGLPGNPSSAMVTFAIFGIPLLRALQGDPNPFPHTRKAKLTQAQPHEPGRLELLRVTLSPDLTHASPLKNQASGAVTTMAMANALVLIPADSTGIAANEEVDVLLLEDLCG